MSVALRPERPPNPRVGLLDRLGPVLLIVATGIVLGFQFIVPDKRMIAVIATIIMFGLAWRLDMAAGLGVLAIALPFPRGTTFGNTNLALVAIIAVIWLLRASLGQSARPQRSPLDVPVLALFVAYVISFYNIANAVDLGLALVIFEMFAAAVLMFFVIVNNLQDERSFRRFLEFQVISVLLVCLLAVWELSHPGQALITGWIELEKNALGTGNAEIFLHNIRVGSSFSDYELLAEYCALNSLLVLFLFLRAETMIRRVALAAMLPLIAFVLFATVTRGAIISLAAGLLYLAWILRRRLNFVMLVTVVVALVLGFQSMNYYVASFTRSGNLLSRFAGSSGFVGVLPEERAGIWMEAWGRIFEHPLIGHGPYYSIMSGTRTYLWPHNLYLLVANNVGFIGLGIFLWLLWTLLKISRPRTDDLRRGEFMDSYMIIAHVQLVAFLIDQTKIDFVRNGTYQFQVWLMFALITAAYRISRAPRALAVVPAGHPRA